MPAIAASSPFSLGDLVPAPVSPSPSGMSLAPSSLLGSITRDPVAMSTFRRLLLDGIQLDPVALREKLGAVCETDEASVERLAQRIQLRVRGNDLQAAALDGMYEGKGGLVEIPLGLGVLDAVGKTVTFTLSSLGGGDELFDCRLFFQDEKELLTYVSSIKIGTRDLWSVSAATGAATTQAGFVTSVARYRNSHPDYKPGQGFHLGKLKIINNNALVIVCSAYTALAVGDQIYAWLSCRPRGGQIGDDACGC